MIAIQNIFDKVFDVVKSNTAIETQKDLALVLGITQQSISDARVRGRFPMEWLIKMSVLYNINLDTMLGLDSALPSSTDKLISSLIEKLEENLKKTDLMAVQLDKVNELLDRES